ncbi:hypothetical protein DMENIID0001_086380 [Sergentomyia squamirostris]
MRGFWMRGDELGQGVGGLVEPASKTAASEAMEIKYKKKQVKDVKGHLSAMELARLFGQCGDIDSPRKQFVNGTSRRQWNLLAVSSALLLLLGASVCSFCAIHCFDHLAPRAKLHPWWRYSSEIANSIT